MRKAVWMSAFVFAAAAGLAVAGTKRSAKVDTPDPATWAGKTLAAGEYTFKWQGDAGNVDVTVLRGNEVVAQGKGRLEERKTKSPDDAVVTRKEGSGAPALTEIEMAGRTTVLVLAHS